MRNEAILPDASGEFSASELASRKVIANPYPYYDLLRAASPVWGYRDLPPGTIPGQDEPKTAWAVLRYNDVALAARDPLTFSSADPLQSESSAPTLMLVNDDPPRHTALRIIAQRVFTPQRIAEKAPWVSAAVKEILAQVGPDEFNFMDTVAPVLPARVMAMLLGADDSIYPKFRKWATAFMLSADLTPAEREASNQEVAGFFLDHVTQRYADIKRGIEPPNDLLTAFIQEEGEGKQLTFEEVVRFCVTLVVAGAETTTFLLGNVAATMIDQPEITERMRADRSLVKPFLLETLRHSGPPQRLFRIATKDTMLGGANIKAGDWVAVFFAAANHDPEVFEDPHTFKLGRPNANKHFTFGHGIHHCAGAALASLEAECLMNALLDHPGKLCAGEAPRVRQTASLLNYGLDKLPVRLTAA